MIQIPTFQNISADFSQEINLNDQIVNLRIIYNIRVSHFFLNFTDQNGNAINGLKIVPEWLLLKPHKGLTDFRGDLIVRKQDVSAGDVITYDNFGNGYNLLFLTQDEVEEWENLNGF